MPTQSVNSITEIPQGSMITFRSKNPNDVTSWIGTLQSIGTYRSILPYGDPAAYHQAVRQIDNTIPSDVTTLKFFLITVDNNSDVPTDMAFADEWISPGTLYIQYPANKVKIEVDDPSNNSIAILQLLASAGYTAKVIS